MTTTHPMPLPEPCGHATHMRRGSTVYGWDRDVDEWSQCKRVPATRNVPPIWERKPLGVEPERDPFMSVKEVAERLAVSKMTTYRLIASGKLRAVQVGRSYRVRQSAYAKYLESAEVL